MISETCVRTPCFVFMVFLLWGDGGGACATAAVDLGAGPQSDNPKPSTLSATPKSARPCRPEHKAEQPKKARNPEGQTPKQRSCKAQTEQSQNHFAELFHRNANRHCCNGTWCELLSSSALREAFAFWPLSKRRSRQGETSERQKTAATPE